MLDDLRAKSNPALDTFCKENVARPHESDDAGYLHFFTQVMTCLEIKAMRVRQLIEEKSRDLLGRAFSRVFSYLLNRDPDFDFNAMIAPLP